MEETSEAVQYATDSLQALERLSWLMRQDEDAMQNYSDAVKDRAHSSLDSLRILKASLEESDKDFAFPQVNEERFIELKQLTLMHIPSSVTNEVKDKFTSMVKDVLKDQVKAVVSITLLTCLWYEASQKERGEMAKHNILLVIFMSHDEQFFSPANPQMKEKASVIDFGWFLAIELSHFGQALGRGRTRYIEAVFCRQGSDIYSSQEWTELQNSLPFTTVTGTKSFQEACLGQAVGGVLKKRKDGQLKLREGATIFEICESFRLLQHTDNSLRLKESRPDIEKEFLPPIGQEALRVIQSLYDHPDKVKCKQDLFQLITEWVKQLRSLASNVKPGTLKSCQAETEQVIGEWLMRSRLQGRTISVQQSVADSHSDLLTLMQEVGGPVASMNPDEIVMVAVAGSAMYNLNTPTSDVDYLIVYSTPTQTLLSSTKKLVECHENRGPEKEIEYGAYEARIFCEMLLKCSVVILELLFSDHHKYMSPMWQELAAHKKSFVTEKAIQQYLGLIKNNFKLIDKGNRLKDPKRDRKLFYQIFHKAHSVESMMKGEIPPVRVEGEIREFIMNVRTKDEGEWTREQVLCKATERYESLREKLCARTKRLRENPDYELCTKWLLKLRGL